MGHISALNVVARCAERQRVTCHSARDLLVRSVPATAHGPSRPLPLSLSLLLTACTWTAPGTKGTVSAVKPKPARPGTAPTASNASPASPVSAPPTATRWEGPARVALRTAGPVPPSTACATAKSSWAASWRSTATTTTGRTPSPAPGRPRTQRRAHPYDHLVGREQARVINGSQDALIRLAPAAVKSLRSPVFLRWGAEMNGDWYAWSGAPAGTTPASTWPPTGTSTTSSRRPA